MTLAAALPGMIARRWIIIEIRDSLFEIRQECQYGKWHQQS
jgi:hypothetical protein